MWHQNSKYWQNAKYKSKQNWTTNNNKPNKAEQEELAIYSSISKLRDVLKNNPGTIEDAF